jgi:hypothetical protein
MEVSICCSGKYSRVFDAEISKRLGASYVINGPLIVIKSREYNSIPFMFPSAQI